MLLKSEAGAKSHSRGIYRNWGVRFFGGKMDINGYFFPVYVFFVTGTIFRQKHYFGMSNHVRYFNLFTGILFQI